MKRRNFIKISSLMAFIGTLVSKLKASSWFTDNNSRSVLKKIISKTPPIRWEDSMISGNGSTAIMVKGIPFDDCIVINHEKFWTVGNDYRPETLDMTKAWMDAKKIAEQGRYRDADEYIEGIAGNKYKEKYGSAGRPRYDRAHPGFHFLISTESVGEPMGYSRETNLETGEISVFWTDNRGDWQRKIFVSRADNIIVMEVIPPDGSSVNAILRLVEAPGKMDGDIKKVQINHDNNEMYFHATYGRTMGKSHYEGYHSLARIINTGGTTRAILNDRVQIKDADKVIIILRVEYLNNDDLADRKKLSYDLSKFSANYSKLLEPHAKIHGEMFNRVTLDLGGIPGNFNSSEQLIRNALEGRLLPEFFELLHAVGRYALICGGTGELAPALMGPWGNEWTPPWDGRYTFDANLELAISAANQGNLPEVMKTYTSFLEMNFDDWKKNAEKMYGCKGALTDLCQGYRHGAVLMPTYPWTGGVGWLSSYMFDYYMVTQDKKYLKEHALPMLKAAAEFYNDFLGKYPEQEGKYVFYPSISPENEPIMIPADQTTNVVPNATCEISICREVFTNLIQGCHDLNVEIDNIPKWKAILEKMPNYVINDDGALAEWAYPGLGDNYHHRHSSHLYGIYPSLEISPERTPQLFKAARIAMEKRIESGLGNHAAHGIMHISLIAARLKNPTLMWEMLSKFASMTFMNTSLITCHYPGPRTYNLDATFSLPAVLMEMLVFSEPGLIELLPALPLDKLPRGSIKGVSARGGIIIEELYWNKNMEYVKVTLTSQNDQMLNLRFGIDVYSINVREQSDENRVTNPKKGQWKLDLTAGRPLTLICNLDG